MEQNPQTSSFDVKQAKATVKNIVKEAFDINIERTNASSKMVRLEFSVKDSLDLDKLKRFREITGFDPSYVRPSRKYVNTIDVSLYKWED